MLKGKNAIITGSTSGIGLAIATELAKKGVNIVINGFGNQQEIDNIISNLSQANKIQAYYHNANLANKAEIEKLIEYTIDKLGSIDILVNNAGIQYVAPIEEFPDDKWEDIININLSASFYTIKRSLKYMKQNNFGRIINIASAHGLVASTHKAAYVAAKHGIVGLSKVVALETAQDNITCNTICPGWVFTPLVEKQIHQKMQDKSLTFNQASKELLAEKQPSLQFTSPEDIGELVVFLSSDAAKNIKGANFSIDGGWTAQ
jgi:3-hydroxybutyrate dehydrogenase